MGRYFYQNAIQRFVKQSLDEILGFLTRTSHFDITDLQRNAWTFEILLLQNILEKKIC